MIEPAISGARVLVVGSAPGVTLPSDEDYKVIGANGGAALGKREDPSLGGNGAFVDVLATTSYLFRSGASAQEQETIRQIGTVGKVGSVWVDEKNGSSSVVASALRDMDMRFGRMHSLPEAARARIVQEACGKALWVSTGVFAACLAVVSSASEIVLCGISLGPGHEGMEGDRAPRHHVGPDAECLQRLARRRGLFTTNGALASSCGITLKVV